MNFALLTYTFTLSQATTKLPSEKRKVTVTDTAFEVPWPCYRLLLFPSRHTDVRLQTKHAVHLEVCHALFFRELISLYWLGSRPGTQGRRSIIKILVVKKDFHYMVPVIIFASDAKNPTFPTQEQRNSVLQLSWSSSSLRQVWWSQADTGFSVTTPQKGANKRAGDETSQSCYLKQPTCPQICLHL